MRSSLGLSLEWQGKELVNKWIAIKITSVRETKRDLVNTVNHTELSFQKELYFD